MRLLTCVTFRPAFLAARGGSCGVGGVRREKGRGRLHIPASTLGQESSQPAVLEPSHMIRRTTVCHHRVHLFWGGKQQSHEVSFPVIWTSFQLLWISFPVHPESCSTKKVNTCSGTSLLWPPLLVSVVLICLSKIIILDKQISTTGTKNYVCQKAHRKRSLWKTKLASFTAPREMWFIIVHASTYFSNQLQ